MLAALEAHLGDRARWTHPFGGLFLFVLMLDGTDTVAAAARGVLFAPVTHTAADGVSGGDRKRLCYGGNLPDEMATGIAELTATLQARAGTGQPLIALRRQARSRYSANRILNAAGAHTAGQPGVAALFATSTSARSASFTDFESRNTLATSGSRMTMFAPSRYRSAYLPRTPREKSYSSRNSSIRAVSGSFFIPSPFSCCRQPSIDQTNRVATHGV